MYIHDSVECGSRNVLHPVESDVIIGEVFLKLINQGAHVCLVVKEMFCDLVQEGVGEGVVVDGEGVCRSFGFDQRHERGERSTLGGSGGRIDRDSEQAGREEGTC